MIDKSEYHQNIKDYYKDGEISYRKVWDLNKSLAIHYGFSDELTKNFRTTLVRMTDVLIESVGLTKDDIVLDAGCGIGGSVFHIVKKIGCKVHGVSISEYQIDKAQEIAQQKNCQELAVFSVGDYEKTNFKDQSFSVIWLNESLVYATDLRIAFNEFNRLLKPGGRIIIGDGIRSEKKFSHKESFRLKEWCKSWAMNQLFSIKEFKKVVRELDYEIVLQKDISKHIKPSSKRLYVLSKFFKLTNAIRNFLSIPYKSIHEVNNAIGAELQYKALINNDWKYYVLVFKNPEL